MKLHGDSDPNSLRVSTSHMSSAAHRLNSTLAEESEINGVEGGQKKSMFRSFISREYEVLDRKLLFSIKKNKK